MPRRATSSSRHELRADAIGMSADKAIDEIINVVPVP